MGGAGPTVKPVVHTLLRCTRLERAPLIRYLNAVPWAWPPEEHPSRSKAEELATRPEPRIGETVLVTAAATHGSVWHYAVEGAPGRSVPFDEAAAAALRTARDLVSQSAAVLWSPLPPTTSAHGVRCWQTLLEPTGVIPSAPAVEGASIGLSLLLAAVSAATHVPVPADLAASVELKAGGGLGAVGLITQKLRVLHACAPGIRRVFLHERNVKEGRAAIEELGLSLTVVKVSSAADALEKAFGDAQVQAFQAAGADPARRADLVGALHDLAIRPDRDELLTWGPVAEAAKLAEAWKDLDADLKQRLKLARLIAVRHDGGLEAELPGEAWVRGLRTPMRHLVLAHLTQHHVDTGVPERSLLDQLLATSEPNDTTNYARLRGARGRVAANEGNLCEAVRLQRAAMATFIDEQAVGELSYQLSELFRVSAVFRNRAVYDHTLTMARRFPKVAASPFVQIFQARAEVCLGLPGGVKRLRTMADHGGAAHVRASALCWLFRTEQTELDAGNAAFARLKDDFVDQDDNIERYRWLWRMHVGDDAEVLASWKGLRGVQGKRCDVVLRGRDEDDPAVLREVAWAWPY